MRIIEKIKSDDLLWHSAILFASMLTVHACSILFQMVVGRLLSEVEYSLLAAFLGALTIIQRPLTTLRTAICHYGSLLEAEGRRGDVKRLLRKWMLLTAVPSLIAGGGVIIFSDALAGFFHLDRQAPVIIVGALFPALCWMPVLNGAALGLQMFVWSSAASFVGALLRLFLGAGLTWFLYKACGWAMLAHGLGIYVTVSALFLGLWLALHGRETSSQPLPSMRNYILQSFFVLAAYAVLMTADVVLVKHYVPSDTEFAYAATLGRMAVFLPGAIVLAMFPKVASSGAASTKHKKIFVRSVGYTLFFSLVILLVSCLFPRFLLRILFGLKDVDSMVTSYVRLMSLMMFFAAVLNVGVQYGLAQRRFKPLFPVVVGAVLYLVAAAFFHETALQLVVIGLCCNILALGVSVFLLLKAE